MGMIIWAIFGALIGWALSDAAGEKSIFLYMIVGVIGALVGGYFTSYIGARSAYNEFDVYSFIFAILCSYVLVAFVKALKPIERV